MIVSPTISPFRWYDRFYEQNRYDVDCSNTCEFKLITDRGHLLPFQIKRDASSAKVIKWILRRNCDPAEVNMLTEDESKFYGGYLDTWLFYDCNVRTIDTSDIRTTSTGETRTLGVVSCSNPDKQCNILRSGSSSGVVGKMGNKLVIGRKYRISVVIGDVSLSAGSNLYMKFNNGATVLIDNINSIGIFEYEFTAIDTDIHFEVSAIGYVGEFDYVGIEEIQIAELFIQNTNDIQLDPQQIIIVNVGTVDNIIYFGDALNVSVPPGDYYSIIKTLDETVYYSEVITVKDFIPGKSKYIEIEWYNDCDIQDVIFQEVNSSLYKNKLYLDDALLTRPEYPFKEEGEEDGAFNFVPTFQKWQKRIQLVIAKCPEFIVDALTAIRMHETINVTNSARNKQLQIAESTTIKSIEATVENIFNDCFQTVTLLMLLDEKYIDETCCSNNTLGEIIFNDPDVEISDDDFVFGIDEDESSAIAVDDDEQTEFISYA